MPAALADLWNRAYALQGIELEDSKSRELVALLLRDLESQFHRSQTECRLLRAYIAYHFPTEATADIDIEHELREVLRCDPDEITARLYLGHFYFDNHDFTKAIRELSQIDVGVYRSANQAWRALKIEELIIAAAVWLGDDENVDANIIKLIEKIESCDRADLAVPLELVVALGANGEKLKAKYGVETIRVIGERLDQLVKVKFGPGTLSED